MMNRFTISIFLLSLVFLAGCKEDTDEYFYGDTEAYVDTDMLSLLKQNSNYSKYVSILEAYRMDTVFAEGRTLTLFIPTNDAMATMTELYLDTLDWIKYLTTESYVNIAQIQGSQKIQTSGEKFALIETAGDAKYLDGVEITYASPLCKNGKYYEIGSLVQPKPNLYEYIAMSNPFVQAFLDAQDSSYLDLELSTPLGYDEFGNTIYDTVLTTINIFEEEYFPISEEFRSKKATMLLFSQLQFDNALALIAQDLNLASASDIPDQWKNDILIPYLNEQGTFWNDLSMTDFASGRIKNIKGDTVFVDMANIDENSSFECSNGRAYNYLDFRVPDSLYKGTNIIQGEEMVLSKGSNLYAWSEDVILTGTSVDPGIVVAAGIADNDSSLVVRFDEPGYAKEFSLTFSFENIFPGTYRLSIRAKTIPSGVFQILVNGQLQNIDLGYGPSDRIDFYDLRNPVRSFTKEVFREANGYNRFDILVENITQYGNVAITLLYVEPGQRQDNGFILDYVLLESYIE